MRDLCRSIARGDLGASGVGAARQDILDEASDQGQAASRPDELQVGRVVEGAVSLGKMATVQTGDEHLDRMAHAVAIDHLRREGV